MLFDDPDTVDFPETNITTESDELSSYGDNEIIEEESDEISDVDTSFYGYDI
ncbi:MAG: hypothetical protein ACOCRK_00315 [bacterium]